MFDWLRNHDAANDCFTLRSRKASHSHAHFYGKVSALYAVFADLFVHYAYYFVLVGGREQKIHFCRLYDYHLCS